MENDSFRALVVDDELPVRTMLARALADVGFQCEQASDGIEAKERLRAAEFDVVITDLAMPRCHGHSLCVDLLNQPDRPAVVVLTGIDDVRILRDLDARGVDILRTKPVNFRQFAKDVRALVDQRSRDRAARGDAAGDGGPSDSTAGSGLAGIHAKHIVGVLTRDPGEAEVLASMLTDDSIEVAVTKSSDELYRHLEKQRLDLLIIENEFGGFVTGLEIVDRLFRQLVHPKVILLAPHTDAVQDRADDLAIDAVISPAASPEEIGRAVREAFAHEGEHNAYIPTKARRIVEDFGEIPPLPQLVVKLAGYLEMPLNEIPLEELARDISVDAKATTQLLKFTNSASVGLARETNSVLQAVKLHGPKKAISQVLMAASVDVQAGLLSSWDQSLQNWYQRRSVMIASVASAFAGRLEVVSADTSFILGLYQEIGCLVLARQYGRSYDHVIGRFRQIGPTQLHFLEQQEFKVNHAHVSAALLQRWRLPQSFIRPVVTHHELDARTMLSKTEKDFLRVMQIGEAVANMTEMPHPTRLRAVNSLLASYGAEKASAAKTAVTEAMRKSRELSELFSYPVPDAREMEKIIAKLHLSGEPLPADVESPAAADTGEDPVINGWDWAAPETQ